MCSSRLALICTPIYSFIHMSSNAFLQRNSLSHNLSNNLNHLKMLCQSLHLHNSCLQRHPSGHPTCGMRVCPGASAQPRMNAPGKHQHSTKKKRFDYFEPSPLCFIMFCCLVSNLDDFGRPSICGGPATSTSAPTLEPVRFGGTQQTKLGHTHSDQDRHQPICKVKLCPGPSQLRLATWENQCLGEVHVFLTERFRRVDGIIGF